MECSFFIYTICVKEVVSRCIVTHVHSFVVSHIAYSINKIVIGISTNNWYSFNFSLSILISRQAALHPDQNPSNNQLSWPYND